MTGRQLPEQSPSGQGPTDRGPADRGRRSVVVVGGGPRGSGLVERLVANAPELLAGTPVTVHVVEPSR